MNDLATVPPAAAGCDQTGLALICETGRMDMLARRVLTALMVVVLASTAACSDPGESAVNPEEALATAKKVLDETSGVKFHLTTKALPDGVDGLMDATGIGTHAPAFKGDVDLMVNGLSLKVPVIAVDDLVYAKLPFTLKFAEIDPADYGAPDPAQLMDTTTGLSSWLTEATDVKKGDRVREGETVLTSYSGILPGKAVVGVIPSAHKSSDFPVTFHIADDGKLKSVDVSGPFYGKGGDVDYTITLSKYGTDEDITGP
ncbi:LppX_LprAFG lipoprotein [Aeromicrobium sp.]